MAYIKWFVILLTLHDFTCGFSASRNKAKDVSSLQSAGPKADSSRVQVRRPSRERQSKCQEAFDAKVLTSLQQPNEDSAALDIFSQQNLEDPSFIRRRPSSSESQTKDHVNESTSSSGNECKGPFINHAHFEFLAFDDIFPNLDFSKHFFTDGEFRQSLRVAMRKDIFYTTAAYTNLPPKIATMMIDDDSSLQGTWNCIPRQMDPNISPSIRMKRLTQVLQDKLGFGAPTGDEFMMKIGSLTGKTPSFHWIDIIGVKDRKIMHSWHQDTGRSYDENNALHDSRFTVMIGFPAEDNYTGCGVFSHCIKLTNEHFAPSEHNENEPVLFEGNSTSDYVVRPEYSYKKEILRYRDVDIIHSAPDVAYRKSVMRFM
jgi:hypothetical protein